MRKIWYFIGILAVGGVVVFLGYNLRSKTKLPQTYLQNTPVASTSPNPVVTAASSGGLGLVFKEQVLGFFPSQKGVGAVDASGRILWTDGKSELVLSSSTIPSAFAASASYDGQFVLVAKGENNNSQYRIWGGSKNSWFFLPSGASSPSFSPNTHQIIYLQSTNGGTQLYLWNLDSGATRGTAIASFPLLDLESNWVSLDKVEFKDKNALLVPSSDFIYNLRQRTVSPVVQEKNGLDLLWNPSGSEALALLGQVRGGNMFLINNSGEIMQTLSILTLPEKCAWSGTSSFFCALPQDSNATKTALPDNFYKNSFFAYDNFYKIDVQSGNVSPVLENQNGLDAWSLAVIGNNLYFINRLDGRLYSVPIPK